MSISRRRFYQALVLILLAILVVVLASCSTASGGSNANPMASPTAKSAAPTTPAPAYPAVGDFKGVMRANAPDDPVLKFQCGYGLTPVQLPPSRSSVEYNGTNIVYTPEETTDFNGNVMQKQVTISFSGKLPFRAVSMIVQVVPQTPPEPGLKDRVVNLSREMLGEPGMVLKTVDFTEGQAKAYIGGLIFCIDPNADKATPSTTPAPTPKSTD